MSHLFLFIIFLIGNTWARSFVDRNNEESIFVSKPIIAADSARENIVPFVTVENYVTQKLDNFDIQNDVTFQQVSVVDNQYFLYKCNII